MISIVIPHLNQPDFLRRCLTSLAAQEPSGHEVEVFVVDNGSAEMPEAALDAYPGATLLRETEPGPGPARNHGVTHAKGDILAFIDADCRADPAWLRVIAEAFQDSDVKVIGGDVRIDRKDPNHATSIEAYESVYAFRMKEYIEKQGFTGTGNLAMRRETYDAVGLFGGLHIAEDRDWGQRATAKGYRTRYFEAMRVYHPAREDMTALTDKWDRHIAHDYRLIRAKPLGWWRWTARSMAMFGSPLVELKRILTSDRISGLNERWNAFWVLVQIRSYRSFRMLNLSLGGDADAMSGRWNRGA